MKLCFVVIVFGLSFIICNKHYIKYSACYKLPIPKTPFYPDAYKFANTKEEFLSNMKLINNAIKVEAIIDTNKLDFNNHTYLFVFGAPIKKMYYSFKTTLFDDKSPSYAKAIRHKKKCVFINYNIPTGYTYLYEIKKDGQLSGLAVFIIRIYALCRSGKASTPHPASACSYINSAVRMPVLYARSDASSASAGR